MHRKGRLYKNRASDTISGGVIWRGLLADIGEVLVRRVHEPVMQEERGAVTQQRITLHLTEADTTMALPTWGRM